MAQDIPVVQGVVVFASLVFVLVNTDSLPTGAAVVLRLLAGAAFLSLSMGFTGLPENLAQWINSLGLSKFQLLMALLVFYIILGCFLDGISSVVLTVAVVGHPERWSTRVALTVVGVVLGAQWVISTLWLSRLRQGPVEWLWRWVTWARRPPLGS